MRQLDGGAFARLRGVTFKGKAAPGTAQAERQFICQTCGHYAGHSAHAVEQLRGEVAPTRFVPLNVDSSHLAVVQHQCWSFASSEMARW